ncbi:MAG: helix-turn-helix transcriptional regulator [Clostridiales bacterium]|nr:helix-turn-helix transcriptional regulator [Clostridiales bacterium]
MNYIQLGANIRAARKRASMTQEVLSEKVGISTVFVSQLENGARKPSLETVYGISKVLNVKMDELTGESFSEEKTSEILNLLENLSEKELKIVAEILRTFLKYR